MKTQQIGFGGFGSFGDKFARQANITSGRIKVAKKMAQLEEAARQVGADLADPEQFRIVQSLIGNG